MLQLLTFLLPVALGPTDVLPSIISGPSSQSVDERTDITFSCEVDGSPDPSVSWFQNDDILPMQNTSSVLITQSGLFSQLRITNVNTSDQGVYRCVATSYIGTASQKAVLQVKSKLNVDCTGMAVVRALPSILVPMALFASLNPQGLGMRNKGLWRQRISSPRFYDFWSSCMQS